MVAPPTGPCFRVRPDVALLQESAIRLAAIACYFEPSDAGVFRGSPRIRFMWLGLPAL